MAADYKGNFNDISAETSALKRLYAISKELIKHLSYQSARQDIDRHVKQTTFTPAQKELLLERSTNTLQQQFAATTSPAMLSYAFQHSFRDSIAKIVNVLEVHIDFLDKARDTNQQVVASYSALLQECLTDIAHNFKMILPPQIGEDNIYTQSLALYENILIPQLVQINAELPKEFGYSPEDLETIFKKYHSFAGTEHLHRIPADQWKLAAK